MARKRRKLDSDKPLAAKPPEAPDRELGGNNSPLIAELHSPARPPVPAVEECTPTNEEVPLVLIAEPQAPTWARQIVRFLQTGELPEDQEEAKRVARRANMEIAVAFLRNTRFGVAFIKLTQNKNNWASYWVPGVSRSLCNSLIY